MSAPQSNTRLRNKVHSELTALHDGGQLAVPSAVEGYLDDPLIEQVAQDYRAECPDTPTTGHAAIITAGVPGAGKSLALNAIAAGYRRIDPDGIKDMLLARLVTAGLLDVRRDHVLADGKPVSPGELSWWVHRVSTKAADLVRAMSLLMGENFVMEGTLTWPPLPAQYVNELAFNDYERLTILDVEVPPTVAVEQSVHRWWSARRTARSMYGVELGGRFISEHTVRQFYGGPRTASTCAANARKLYGEANDAGIETELLIVSRTASGTEYRACLTADSDIRPWQGAPLGAVCVICGGILTHQKAIREGVSRSRIHKS